MVCFSGMILIEINDLRSFKWQIHSWLRFTCSFNAPWSVWSWISVSGEDHRKEVHLTVPRAVIKTKDVISVLLGFWLLLTLTVPCLLYYNLRSTSRHVQKTYQLISECHYWRMPPIHSASSGPKVTKMWDGLKDLRLYNFNLIFSSSLFAIHVNLLHP